MNTSKTTIAAVRRIIGLGQKGMADLVGCSIPTIQALEYKRLKLSQSLAERISAETGVSLKWLLDGKLSKKPVSEYMGENFTRQTYEETQAGRKQVPDFSFSNARLGVALGLTFRIQRLCAILAKANAQGKYRLCGYKFDSILDDLEKEFGADKSIEDQLYFLAPCGKWAGIPEIIDVAPIIETFHKKLCERPVAPRPKRRPQPYPAEMPEKPIANDYRVKLAAKESDADLMLGATFFRRKDVTEKGWNPLGLYIR